MAHFSNKRASFFNFGRITQNNNLTNNLQPWTQFKIGHRVDRAEKVRSYGLNAPARLADLWDVSARAIVIVLADLYTDLVYSLDPAELGHREVLVVEIDARHTFAHKGELRGPPTSTAIIALVCFGVSKCV